MKNNQKIRQKRKLIKTTIIGIVVLIVIQLFIIYILLSNKYQCQQANSDNTYTETIYVDRVVYVNRTRSLSSSINIYSDDIKWKLSPKLAREHTEKSPDEICQSLEGALLTVTYKKVFMWWSWDNVIVDARDEDIVYYTIDEYNANNENKDRQRIWLWVIFEFIYVMCSGAWMLYEVIEWKSLVMKSEKKNSKVRKK